MIHRQRSQFQHTFELLRKYGIKHRAETRKALQQMTQQVANIEGIAGPLRAPLDVDGRNELDQVFRPVNLLPHLHPDRFNNSVLWHRYPHRAE